MAFQTDIGKRFRQIRRELGLNQTDMGKLISKKQRAVSYYEEGRMPDQDALKVLHSMGFSIDWLLTGEGFMHLQKGESITHPRPGQIPSVDSNTMTFLNHMQDGVLIIQDGIQTFANKAIEYITGYSIEEHVGLPLGRLTAPELENRLHEEHRKILKRRKTPAIYTLNIKCKNGVKKDVIAYSTPILYKGKPALLAIVRDVTGYRVVKHRIFRTS